MLSLLLALIPLLGIAYAVISGGGLTIDNLFLVLVLLTISGIFALNAFLDARARGLLSRKKAAENAPAAQKAVGPKTT